MVDVVNTQVVENGIVNFITHLTNVSDGTGESAVIKVDKSTLVGPQLAEPSSLALEWIRWSIQGFSSVRLFWDHTTDDEMMVLAAGNGYEDFRPSGRLQDPATAGDTGDVLLTTAGAVSGATYDITAAFRKKQ